MSIGSETDMDGFYPDWWSCQRTETVCIPACHDVFKGAYRGPTDPQASNYDEKTYKEKERYYKGQEAENAFFRSFQKLNLGGVLVSEFESAIFKKQKKARLKKFGIEDFEIDAIFMHPSMGILTVEIKATEISNGNSHKQYEKAVSQLNKLKEQLPTIFRRLCNCDSDFNIPFHLAVCFPNSLLNDKKENQFIHIDKSCFDDSRKMRKIFTDRMTFVPDVNTKQFEMLKRFACAISAYRSKELFTSAGLNALEVHKMINSQSFDLSSKTACSEYMFTNEQLKIRECTDERQIVSGPPGTGKTLLLMYKALDAAKDGKKVIVITGPNGIRQKFQDFFVKQIDDARFLPSVIGELTEEIVEPDSYIFIDEHSIFDIERNPVIKLLLTKGVNFFIVNTGAMSPIAVVFMEEFKTKYELLGVRCFLMNTVIRSSKTIFFEWKAELENVEIHIGHNCLGPSIVKITAFNSDQILQNIFDIISDLKRQIGSDSVLYPNLAIITNFGLRMNIFNDYLNSKGIPCGTVSEQLKTKDVVAVCTFGEAMSLEWPFVIVVSLYSLDLYQNFMLLATSRCIAQLYIIDRDYLSIQAIIEENINAIFSPEVERISDYDTFLDIVKESETFFEEKLDAVFLMDCYFALVKLNFLITDAFMQSIEGLKGCKTLFECLFKIALSEDLCDLLSSADGKSNFGNNVIRDWSNRLFNNLCFYHGESEKNLQWKILNELQNNLILSIRKRKTTQTCVKEKPPSDVPFHFYALIKFLLF